ncbi:MAG TPA: biotin/lipoyl-containing protein [Vicinamibacterales bacterium]|jgi:biotin carboxyl carrier protein|nr:biotin/lipoyl-containing protein [Vicinamibacterales bacterium]
MQYVVEVGGRPRTVTVARSGDGFTVTIDGTAWPVRAALVDPRTISLLVDDHGLTISREVTIAASGADGALTVRVGSMPVAVTLDGRRRWGRADAAGAGGGPQRIAAPMPGKIVRVLAAPGDAVRSRQPLVVIEAMKMENELRAPGDGVVAEMHAREGASVEAGALLVVLK